MILVIFQSVPNYDYSEMIKYTFYPLSAVLTEHYYSPLTYPELLNSDTVPHPRRPESSVAPL
jgi:hypothetical protein